MRSIDIQKQELKKKSDQLRENFSDDLSEFIGKVERGVVTGLIAGGLAVIVYKFIERSLSDEQKDKGPEGHNESNWAHASKFLAESLVIFLLNLAKEKILEYLQERKGNETTENTSTDN